MAGSMMVSLPTMIVFAFLQHYLVQGLTAGAVKDSGGRDGTVARHLRTRQEAPTHAGRSMLYSPP